MACTPGARLAYAEPDVARDLLDEEFQRYLEIAKALIKEIKRQEDREICVKYIKKCLAMNVPNLSVKRNRNDFFKFFLKTLQTSAENQPPEYDDLNKPVQSKEPKEMNYFSKDGRSYVAAKVIPGFGALVYMAVAEKPELGWQKCGFSSYTF